MPNVHTLRDIENRRVVEGSLSKYILLGYRLDSIRESELEKVLHGSIKTASNIANNYKNLQNIYLEQVKDFNCIYSDFNNKFSQLNTANTELKAKYSAEIKSLKSSIKILKKELTLAQKASFSDKVIILFLEAKIVELKDKLKDIDLERTYHDLNVIEGMIEKPAQINSFNPKEIDSLRLELKQMKKDLNSKEYIIEYMKKGIESSNSIFRQKIDILSSARLNLLEKNTHLQELLLKKDNEIDTLLPPMNDLS